ncbi:MAG TPA: protein kinase [Planctomycetota bacterium]|nr:protein kinase [Planctomycetota bacterium]
MDPNPGSERTLPLTDAAVMTPAPDGNAAKPDAPAPDSGASLTVNPTVRGTPHVSPAFSGAMGTGGLASGFHPSIPPQNLLDDKLILSAPRVDSNGQTVPVLGGIQLFAKLGQGGMGAVYYGVHPRLNQEVAVKVLPFHLAEQQPGLVQRFIREAQIAARVRSEHLVGVIDVNEESGLFYLVMEYVNGKSAGEYLRAASNAAGARGVPEIVALAICIGAAEGLAAAHANGVIHRDIKPDNIMIPRAKQKGSARASGSAKAPSLRDSAGVPTLREGAAAPPPQPPPPSGEFEFKESKLADLGLARNEFDSSMTGANACMGTPGYMAPEQAQDAKHASKPADVFSLGATLYALLSGDAPFKGSSLMQVLNATVNEPHAPIQNTRPDISAPTIAVLDRCLAKKAEDRFPDASALLRAMRLSLAAIGGPAAAQAETLRAVTMLVNAPETGIHANLNLSGLSVQGHAAVATIPLAGGAESAAGHGAKRNWVPLAAALLVGALGAACVGGYFIWQKIERDKNDIQADIRRRDEQLDADSAARQDAEREMADEKLRNAALEEETARMAAWKKARDDAAAEETRLLDEQKRKEQQRQAALKKAAADAAERDRRAKEDRERIAEVARLEKIEKQKMAAEALSAAMNVALDYKRKQNWDGVILALEDPLKAIGDDPHPNRAAVEAMLKDAREQKERQKQLKAEIDKGNEQLKLSNFESAKNIFDAARKLAVESSEIIALNDAIKRANEGLKKNKLSQARIVETQARTLRPDKNPKGDWAKAAEGFKNAGAIFKDIDEKDDYARTLMEQAECFRKDLNKNGDWTEAAALYSAAAASYLAQGDRKNQAEALLRHAQCVETTNNPAGDNRQAAALFGRAALLQGEAGNKKGQAEALSLQGACLFREKSLPLNSMHAAEVFKRAALLYEELGEKKAQGLALLNNGICLVKGQKQNMTPEARTVFQSAAKISRDAGDENDAKLAEGWLK